MEIRNIYSHKACSKSVLFGPKPAEDHSNDSVRKEALLARTDIKTEVSNVPDHIGDNVQTPKTQPRTDSALAHSRKLNSAGLSLSSRPSSDAKSDPSLYRSIQPIKSLQFEEEPIKSLNIQPIKSQITLIKESKTAELKISETLATSIQKTKKNSKRTTNMKTNAGFTNRTIKMALMVILLLVGQSLCDSTTISNVSINTDATSPDTTMPDEVSGAIDFIETTEANKILWGGAIFKDIKGPSSVKSIRFFDKDGNPLASSARPDGQTAAFVLKEPLNMYFADTEKEGTIYKSDISYSNPTWTIGAISKTYFQKKRHFKDIRLGLNLPGTDYIYFGGYKRKVAVLNTSTGADRLIELKLAKKNYKYQNIDDDDDEILPAESDSDHVRRTLPGRDDEKEEEPKVNNGPEGHDEKEKEPKVNNGPEGHDEKEKEPKVNNGPEGHDEKEKEPKVNNGPEGHDEKEKEPKVNNGPEGHEEDKKDKHDNHGHEDDALEYDRTVSSLNTANGYLELSFQDHTSIILMSTLDFSVIKELAGLTSTINNALTNNLNQYELYGVLEGGNNPTFLQKWNLGDADAASPVQYSTGNIIYSIVNFGTYHYLGLGFFDRNSILLLDKSNLNLSTDLTLQGYGHWRSMRSAIEYERKFYIAQFIHNPGYNFQSYYLTFDDYCEERTADICTDCTDGYFRNSELAFNKCILPAEFPPKYGKDGPNELMKACSVPNCSSCLEDYSVCNGCSAGFHLATLPGDTAASCVSTSDIPSGYGFDSNGDLVTCADPNCDNCRTNKDVCVRCINSETGEVASTRFYLFDGTDVCTDVNDITGAFGYDYVTNRALACTSNCDACKWDYKICTIPSAGHYLDTTNSGNQCLSIDSISAGQGVNSSYLLENCQDPNCKYCKADYTTCTECESLPLQYYYHDESGTKTCELVSSIPAGSGFKDASSDRESCFANCQLCQSDYLICTLPATDYYLTSSGVPNSVALIDSIDVASGTGYNPSTYLVESCIENCAECQKTDYFICTKPAANYYLKLPNNSLELISSIPSQKGYDPMSYGTQDCDDTNCDDCQADYATCQVCLANYVLHDGGSGLKCTLLASLPLNLSVDPSALPGAEQMVACAASPNCKDCRLFSTRCDVPEDNYYLIDGDATNNTVGLLTPPPSVGTGYNPNTYKVGPCSESVANCDECEALNSLICTKPATDYYLSASGVENTCALKSGYTQVAGQGWNGTLYTYVPCNDINCSDCNADYLTCTLCKTDFYYNQVARRDALTTIKCYYKDDILPGFGIKSDGQLIEACTPSDCSSCRDDYTVCTTCNSGFQVASGSCVIFIAICDDVNCATCSTDVNTCDLCNAGFYRIDQADTYECYNPTAALTDICAANSYLEHTVVGDYYTCTLLSALNGTNYGYNSLTKSKTACLAGAECDDCVDDYKVCNNCKDTGSDYYYLDFEGEFNSCYQMNAISAGQGKVPSKDMLAGCTVSQCNLCETDNTACTECKTGHYLADSTTCSPISSIPAGSGFKSTSENYDSCQVSNCAECQSDYTKCEKCTYVAGDPAQIFYKDAIVGTTCTLVSSYSSADGISGVYDPATTLITETACATSDCKTCSNFRVCTRCLDTHYLGFEAAGNSCTLIDDANIGDYLGYNSTSGTLEKCSIDNCQNCWDNSSTCVACHADYYWDSGSGSCKKTADIPVTGTSRGKGLNATNNNMLGIADCDITECTDCRFDKATCTYCTNDYFLKSDGSACEAKTGATYPDEQGFDFSTGKLGSCQVTDCKSCVADTRYCTYCNDGYYLEHDSTKDGNFICSSIRDTSANGGSSGIPAGFGFDSTSGEAIQCTNKFCDVCQDNYAVCTDCKPGYIEYSDGCELPVAPYVPDGSGYDSSTNSLKPCSVDNCELCAADYSVCTQCKSTFFRSDNTGKFCITASQSPVGQGPNVAENIIQTCDASNCQDCKEDYMVCNLCKTSYARQFSDGKYTCIHNSDIPAGFGINREYNLIRACKKAGCTNCFLDYTICQNCLDENCSVCSSQDPNRCVECNIGYFLNSKNTGNRCAIRSSFPGGYGVVIDESTLMQPCTVEGCKDCSNDNLKCNACTDIYKLLSTAPYCEKIDKIVKDQTGVVETPYACTISMCAAIQNDMSTVTLQFNNPLTADQLSRLEVRQTLTMTDGLLCRSCGEKSSWYLSSDNIAVNVDTDMSTSFPPEKIQITTTLQGMRRALQITAREAADDYESDIELLSKIKKTHASEVFAWFLKIWNFITMTILAIFFPIASRYTNQLFAWVGSLRMLDGPLLRTAGVPIHYLSSNYILPFWITNPYLKSTQDKGCAHPDHMKEHGYECNIIANFGQNFNIMLAALVVNLIVFSIFKGWKRRTQEQDERQIRQAYYKGVLLTRIRRFFGLRYFYQFTEAYSLELFGIAFINIGFLNTKPYSIVGFCISLAVLVYLVTLYTFIVKFVIQVNKELKENQQLWTSNTDMSNLKTVYDSDLAFVVERYKVKQWMAWGSWLPIITPAKFLLVQILAIALSTKGLGQLVPILIVEFIYYVLVWVSCSRKSIFDNLYDLVFSLGHLMYLVTKIASTIPSYSVSYVQEKVGYCAASLLLLVAFACLIHAALITVETIYNLIRSQRQAKTLKDSDSKSVQSQKTPTSFNNQNRIELTSVDGLGVSGSKKGIVMNPLDTSVEKSGNKSRFVMNNMNESLGKSSIKKPIMMNSMDESIQKSETKKPSMNNVDDSLGKSSMKKPIMMNNMDESLEKSQQKRPLMNNMDESIQKSETKKPSMNNVDDSLGKSSMKKPIMMNNMDESLEKSQQKRPLMNNMDESIQKSETKKPSMNNVDDSLGKSSMKKPIMMNNMDESLEKSQQKRPLMNNMDESIQKSETKKPSMNNVDDSLGKSSMKKPIMMNNMDESLEKSQQKRPLMNNMDESIQKSETKKPSMNNVDDSLGKSSMKKPIMMNNMDESLEKSQQKRPLMNNMDESIQKSETKKPSMNNVDDSLGKSSMKKPIMMNNMDESLEKSQQKRPLMNNMDESIQKSETKKPSMNNVDDSLGKSSMKKPIMMNNMDESLEKSQQKRPLMNNMDESIEKSENKKPSMNNMDNSLGKSSVKKQIVMNNMDESLEKSQQKKLLMNNMDESIEKSQQKRPLMSNMDEPASQSKKPLARPDKLD